MQRRPLLVSLVAATLLLGSFAPAASAVSIRVDFTASVTTMWGDRSDITGSLGTFEVTSFPSVLPLATPFSLVATDWGFDRLDTTYTFANAGGLGFEFTTPQSGRIVGLAAPGYTRVTYEDCYPTHCGALESWSVQIGPGALVQVIHGGHVGGDVGSAQLAFALTQVPQASTATLLVLGLALLRPRSSH